jgi:hypothetical protein
MTVAHNDRRPIVSTPVSRMAARWWVLLLRGLADARPRGDGFHAGGFHRPNCQVGSSGRRCTG